MASDLWTGDILIITTLTHVRMGSPSGQGGDGLRGRLGPVFVEGWGLSTPKVNSEQNLVIIVDATTPAWPVRMCPPDSQAFEEAIIVGGGPYLFLGPFQTPLKKISCRRSAWPRGWARGHDLILSQRERVEDLKRSSKEDC